MNKACKFFLLLALPALFGTTSLAQTSNVLDGVYIKEHTSERKVIPYAHLREADVMWAKRVWRVIDLREKANHDLYYPQYEIIGRKSLMQVIWEGVNKDGTITPYEDETADCQFTTVLSASKLNADLFRIDTLYVPDPDDPDVLNPVPDTTKFLTSEVKSYRVKEDWFFDKQRSVMDVRIIGICPVREYEKNGTLRITPMFWIYFPEARFTFKNAEVYNKGNDAERRTYEDIFWKRKFSSYIYRESNVYQRSINEYTSSLETLLEADRIKDEMFNFEHDLWEY